MVFGWGVEGVFYRCVFVVVDYSSDGVCFVSKFWFCVKGVNIVFDESDVVWDSFGVVFFVVVFVWDEY